MLCELRRLQRAHPTAATVIAEQLTYLEPRQAQMAYAAFAAAGWPLGSGIVESANKRVVEARLTGTGMRWTRAQVNPVLGLRTVVCNDRWAEVGPQVVSGWRARVRQAAAQRGHQRRATAARDGPCAEIQAATSVDRAVVAEVAAILAGPPAVWPAGAAPRARPSAAAPGPHRPAGHHPWRRSPIGNATRMATDAPAIAKG